jgi:catalase
MGNFQRDGAMAYYNQGSRPNYISTQQTITFRPGVEEKDHREFVAEAVSWLSSIRPEDFNAPRNLWEKVFNDEAKARFVKTVSGHMSTVSDKEIIKRQITIFREVSDDLATRLEKATGVKGGASIKGVTFNGCNNAMDAKPIPANNVVVSDSVMMTADKPQRPNGASAFNNGGPP